MSERSVIKSAIHPRFIAGVVGGAVVVALGLFFVGSRDLESHLPIIGWVLVALALCALVVVFMTRRTQIVADAERVTLVRWMSTESVDWKRLSSLQFQRAEGGSEKAARLVAVNDMGRKSWEIPLHYFNRDEMRAWTATLPVRVQGLDRL